MNTIPKIIHQTWKVKDIPPHLEILVNTWKKFHSDWKYKLWTNETDRNFIKDNYPEFLDKYDSYPRDIQRADAVRYFILHKEGGVYIDLDYECLKNISFLLKGATCVIGKEPELHCKVASRELILCNAFMASTPNNDFMKFTCKKVMDYPLKLFYGLPFPIDILESTGPFILTDAFLNYTYKDKVKILESDLLYPLTRFDIRRAFKEDVDDTMQEKINGAYAVHYSLGSW